MKTRTLVTAALAALVLALPGGGVALSASTGGHSNATKAREVARKFFQTINSRSFGRTCELMSTRFYRQNHIPDKCRLNNENSLHRSQIYRTLTLLTLF